MRTKRILIDYLDQSSIDNAISELNNEKTAFERDTHQVLKQLADIAKNAIQQAFGSAATVSVQQITDGYSVSANGDAIIFLEFGAGDMTDSSDRYASSMPFPVRPGSWSSSADGSKMYSRFGFWVFGGRQYRYIMPRNGMQKGYEAIIQNIQNVANSVFT